MEAEVAGQLGRCAYAHTHTHTYTHTLHTHTLTPHTPSQAGFSLVGGRDQPQLPNPGTFIGESRRTCRRSTKVSEIWPFQLRRNRAFLTMVLRLFLEFGQFGSYFCEFVFRLSNFISELPPPHITHTHTTPHILHPHTGLVSQWTASTWTMPNTERQWGQSKRPSAL